MELRTPKISVCVVARNGEATYKRIFESLREFADRGGDMVLVDTGSTDRTKTLYRAFGFRVFEVGDKFNFLIPDDIREKVNSGAAELGEGEIIPEGARVFNFADARNYAASLAKNDYIINIDADEEISSFDIDACEDAFSKITRFRYDFVYNHRDDGSPLLEFVTDTRASDRRHWQWKGVVHETNEPIGDGNHNMAYVPPNVFKVEHWQIPSPTRDNYLAGLAYACAAQPENDRNSHYYARELMYRGYKKSAIREFMRHLTISNWDMEKSQSILYMADCLLAIGQEEQAIEWYNKSFYVCQRREPLLRLAMLYRAKDNALATLAYTAAALEVPLIDFYGKIPDYYGITPYKLMYWAKWWSGDKEGSKKYYELAKSIDPNDVQVIGDSVFYTPECTICQ